MWSFFLLSKLDNVTLETLVNADHGGIVIKLPAILRSTKYSDEFPVSKKLISIFHNLVSAHNQINIVFAD